MTYILNIKCADGEKLPYLGYIEIDLKIVKGIPNAKATHVCTNYSYKTPLILGINILNEQLLEENKINFGDQVYRRLTYMFHGISVSEP